MKLEQVNTFHVLVALKEDTIFTTEHNANKEKVEKLSKFLKEKMPDHDVYLVHTHSKFGHEDTPTEVTL